MFLPIGDNVHHRTFPLMPCVLIGLNLVSFAYQTRLFIESEGDSTVLQQFVHDWGLVPEKLAEGKTLGLFTHMFLHAGVVHLAGNMIVLWAFAASLEVGLGPLCFLAFYILWGLLAGLAHAATDWGSSMPMVGASGAIAGLIGAYTVAFGASAKIRGRLFLGFHSIPVQIPAAAFGVFWIGFQLWDASNDPQGLEGVAWYAHIGGFFTGAVTMWLAGSFMERELISGSDGQPVFVDKNKPTPAIDEPSPVNVAPTEDVDPTKCPYCRTELDVAVNVAAGLIRCGNPGCERLIYSEAPATV